MSTIRTCIKPWNGAPTVFVNDEPIFLNAPYLQKAPYASFAPAKTGLYMTFDHAFEVDRTGSVDSRGIREKVDEILDREPGAYVIVRSFPPVPLWWLEAHPEEELRFDVDLSRYPGLENYRDASWGSERYLRKVEGWYRELCSSLHRHYQGRIIGYQFGMGSAGENNQIGASASDGRWFCGDFSPAMHEYFRGWLRTRYATDEALREAWGDPGVTFQTAMVPGRIERLRTDWFTFRDPRKRQTADYIEAFADRVAECVIRVCRAIKEATGYETLAGSHLGAIMDNGFHGYLYNQTAINKVHRALRDPAVDLFTSPASYDYRDPGGDATSMMPVGSYLLHGKMIFQDQDTRTHHIPAKVRKNFTLGRIARNARETEGVLKRDFGYMLIHGYGLWWHAMVPGMYDAPEVRSCVARLSEIGRRSLRFSRGIAEGAAIVVDEESAFHQQCANRLLFPMLYYQRQRYWNRSGVPWSLFLHNDLADERFEDRSLYYFLNTFYLTDEEIEAIEGRVKRNGATVVWSFAPGVQSPGGIDLARAERLSGFRLRAADVEALPRITITHDAHPMTREIRSSPGGESMRGRPDVSFFGVGPMGNDEQAGKLGPMIYVDDPEATVLGELDALQKPGFCVKEMDGWTSVFVSAPMLNPRVFRGIARSAGIHIYSEGDDVVLAGRRFLMLHARTGGEKRVILPEARDVYECYDGRTIGRGVREFRDKLGAHQTGLYFFGTESEWKGNAT